MAAPEIRSSCFMEEIHHSCGCIITTDVNNVTDCERCFRPDRVFSSTPPEDLDILMCQPLTHVRTSALPCYDCVERRRDSSRKQDNQILDLRRNIDRGVGCTWVGGTNTGTATDRRPRDQEKMCIVCLIAEPKMRCSGYGAGFESCDGHYYCIPCWTATHKANPSGHKVSML